MAKLFYTLEETAKKLKMSEAQVKQLVSNNQLQEFRDRDRLMFKVDQVDLLAHGGEEEGGTIPLADSGEISLASDSGSAMNVESLKEQTGISIFDADQTDEADPSAVTQVTETSMSELAMETAGSGSGLLDLTREADDTSLGQDLLQNVEKDGSTAAETAAEGGDGGALFESTGAETETATVAPAMLMLGEPYDAGASGLSGGLALGMLAVAAFTLALTIFGLNGFTDGPIVNMIGSEGVMMWAGIAAAVVLVFGLIGWAIGRKG